METTVDGITAKQRPGNNGLMQNVLNPIIEYRYKAVKKFQHGMERLRAEAIKRKFK